MSTPAFTCPHCGEQLSPTDVAALLESIGFERASVAAEQRFDAPPHSVGRPVELPDGPAFFVDRAALARRKDEVLRDKERKK